MANSSAMTVKGRQALDRPARGKEDVPVFKPPVDIFQTDREVTLIADMPGVAPEDITVDLRGGVLTLGGSVRPWEGAEESDVRIEFEIGRYVRRFTLSEDIDHERIDARCSDGTLRLTLPIAEKGLPKRIAVRTG